MNVGDSLRHWISAFEDASKDWPHFRAERVWNDNPPHWYVSCNRPPYEARIEFEYLARDAINTVRLLGLRFDVDSTETEATEWLKFINQRSEPLSNSFEQSAAVLRQLLV